MDGLDILNPKLAPNFLYLPVDSLQLFEVWLQLLFLLCVHLGHVLVKLNLLLLGQLKLV